MGQVFPPAISYGGFFPSEASTLVLADEQMPMMPASSSQAVGLQTTLPQVNPPTLRIAPLCGKGDPLVSVTGVLPSVRFLHFTSFSQITIELGPDIFIYGVLK